MPGLLLHLPSGEKMKYDPPTYLKHLQGRVYEAECASSGVDPEESQVFADVEMRMARYNLYLYACTPQKNDNRHWRYYREEVEPDVREKIAELTELAESILNGIEDKPWYPLIEAHRMIQTSHKLDARACAHEESDPVQAMILYHESALLFQQAHLMICSLQRES